MANFIRSQLQSAGRRRLMLGGVVAAIALASAGTVATGVGLAQPTKPGPLKAKADIYGTNSVGSLTVRGGQGILANDSGGQLQIVSHTDPAHGSLTLNPNGSFEYIPQDGFVGTDTFTYTITNSVHLYTTHLPALGNFGGVSLSGGGYGSSLYPDPGHPNLFYGLEDRGPNVTAADGNDVEPIPTFDPGIGLFRFVNGNAVLLRRIPLEDAEGRPFSGLVNSQNPTGEKIEDLDGNVLAQDPNGYDSEGLVAMPDGTFYVSDEYGPFITHFNHNGRQISRLSPLDGSLPQELANRVPNRGMEGLTITPNGKMLVGMMQSALQQPDLNGSNAKNLAPVRIVTFNLRTHAEHEYLYLLHDPKVTGTAVSEITALTNSTFLVDERDGNFPAAGGFKQLWKINLAGATDVGPKAKVANATYNATGGGLLVGGKTIEDLTLGEDTADASATLVAAGIKPVSSSEFLDVDQLLGSLDPNFTFFSHDKVEGVAALDGGREIVISNDSDFGIAGVTNAAPPWQLEPKISPTTGKQDDGEYLVIDMKKLPAGTSTATVTINVRAEP